MSTSPCDAPTAAVTGGPGTLALRALGRADRQVKPLKLGGVLIGGGLFGAGMALLGHCPGTSVAAVGEGRGDALAGVAGMLLGALLFVKLYPDLKPWLDKGDLGEVTVGELAEQLRSGADRVAPARGS